MCGRCIAGAPNDTRLLMSLARSYEEIGEHEAAIEALELILAARGASWKTLIRIGDLYHQMDRREDAIDCGKRLFAIVRVPQRDDEDEDEADKKKT